MISVVGKPAHDQQSLDVVHRDDNNDHRDRNRHDRLCPAETVHALVHAVRNGGTDYRNQVGLALRRARHDSEPTDGRQDARGDTNE